MLKEASHYQFKIWFMEEKNEEKFSGRCMRCKDQREMKGVKDVVFKNGMLAKAGVCAQCGTKMVKIVGKKKE